MKKYSPKQQKPQTKFNRGFTLIELLVTIAIIAVLSAVLIANMVGIRERASDTRTKNDLNQLKKALRLYYNDNQSYVTGYSNFTECSSALPGGGGVFKSSSGTVYMKELPEKCFYKSGSDSEGFVLRAPLKNAGDEDIAKSASSCGETPATGEHYYYVCAD